MVASAPGNSWLDFHVVARPRVLANIPYGHEYPGLA